MSIVVTRLNTDVATALEIFERLGTMGADWSHLGPKASTAIIQMLDGAHLLDVPKDEQGSAAPSTKGQAYGGGGLTGTQTTSDIDGEMLRLRFAPVIKHFFHGFKY
jgi:hypothetical protein